MRAAASCLMPPPLHHYVTITVHKDSGTASEPVAGATVRGTWSNGASSCTTNLNGQCSVTKSVNKRTSSVIFTVDAITHTDSTLIYDPSRNAGSTSSITVSRP